MANKDVTCYYDALVGVKDPVVVAGDWINIRVRELTPGEFYVAPFYLWAPKSRDCTVQIYRAGSTSNIVLTKKFKIGPNTDSRGNPAWISKRYKLNSERHDDSAYIRIGGTGHGGVPFNIYADELTSKSLVKRKLRDKGLCPTCGQEGYWHSLAKVCPEHGVYI